MEAIRQLRQIDCFLLQRAPEPSHEDVVHAAAPPVHGDAGSGLGQPRDPTCAIELAALIGIHNRWCPVFGNGLI